MAQDTAACALRSASRATHQHAEALGISPPRLRERRAGAGLLTRRGFSSGPAPPARRVRTRPDPACSRAAARAASGAKHRDRGRGIAGLTARADPAGQGRLVDRLRVALDSRQPRMHSDCAEFHGYWANGQRRRALRRADRQQPRGDPPDWPSGSRLATGEPDQGPSRTDRRTPTSSTAPPTRRTRRTRTFQPVHQQRLQGRRPVRRAIHDALHPHTDGGHGASTR